MDHKKVKKMMAFREGPIKDYILHDSFENLRDGEFRSNKGFQVWFLDKKTGLYKKAVLNERNGRKIELKTIDSKLSIYTNSEDVLEIDEAQPEMQDLLFMDHANEPNLIKLFKKKISANSLETLLGTNIIHLKPVSMQKQRGKNFQALKTFNSYFGQNVYSLKNEDPKSTSFDVLMLTGTYFSGKVEIIYYKIYF
jgi:hypothetical protein